MITNILRKNIGTIIAAFGFVLLCIITYGDLGEILTEAYWQNVKENLTSIGFLSVALTMIQVSIKQGVSEQALQRGLNTTITAEKYKDHRNIIHRLSDKMIYLPYFLRIYNDRHTALRKREFLVDNNYSSEKTLFASGRKRLVRRYKKINTQIIASRIKWATTDIVYNKKGQIRTLAEHRSKRTTRGIIFGLVFMVGMSLLARGLFFEDSGVSIGEKTIKLLSYVIVIAMTSVLAIIKEYEKGAFGVPNELEEINQIWKEFEMWTVPQWVKDEVEAMNEERIDIGTDVQEEPQKGKVAQEPKPAGVLPTVKSGTGIRDTGAEQLSWQFDRNNRPVR